MPTEDEYFGLTPEQVTASREKYGTNLISPVKRAPLWKLFLWKFRDPLIIILLIAGFLSLGIACYEYCGLNKSAEVFFEPVGIFVAVMIATGVAFVFEYNADKRFRQLRTQDDDEPVEVIRSGNATLIPKRDVVVGDIVIIDTGAEIPADGILKEAVSLSVDESMLTGEPISRKSIRPEEYDHEATYPTNEVFRGTHVKEGHGLFLVKRVGDHTEEGRIMLSAEGVDMNEEETATADQKRAQRLQSKTQMAKESDTPLNRQLNSLAAWISKASYVFAALIIVSKLVVYFHWAAASLSLAIPTAAFFYLVICRFAHWKWKAIALSIALYFVVLLGMVTALFFTLKPTAELADLITYTLDTLMIAVTLIVVAVPEGLPMAVTLSLAYSMQRMLKNNNLVRKMHACETMGAATVICTDKTGTLTQNRMQVADTHFISIPSTNFSASPEGRMVMEGIAVNSSASLDFSDPAAPTVIGNPTEGALLLWLKSRNIDYRLLREEAPATEELPFTTDRKYMATVVKSGVVKGQRVLYVKGAPEIVMALCGDTIPMATQQELAASLQTYQNQTMRTLGFAYKILEDNESPLSEGRVSATSLVFQGIVAISDPVRQDVPAAVKECMDAGIEIKIVTGDTPGTAREIGRQIGLWRESDGEKNIITGPEFARLTDKELDQRISELKIIARARPMDKKRLVLALQKQGHVVAVTGDGTNDAPALKAANVGLSMGDGTAVAKEASDITILNNSFSSISQAVMWGRSLYRNIQRFLLFQLTVNVAACLIVLCGAFMGTQSPLTVTQMLWVNLIMDTFAAMALASLPPSHSVMKERPRPRNAFILSKDMSLNILGVGGFFFALLLVLLFIFEHANITCLTDLLHLHLAHPNGLAGTVAANIAQTGNLTDTAAVNFGKADGLTPYELTLFFTIFVMTHFFYLFCARAFETGRSALHFRGCRGLLIIAVIILLGQIAMVEVPGLQKFFNVVSLKPLDWVIIIVGSSFVLWVREVWHFLKRAFA